MKRYVPFVALALAAIAVAAPAAADTRVVQKIHSEGLPGQNGAKDGEVELWVAKDRVTQNSDNAEFILRLDQNKLYIIDRPSKRYAVLAVPIDPMQLVPEDQRERVKAMIPMMKMTAKITPTEETAKIGSWSAKKYDVELTGAAGTASIEIWNTTDIAQDLAPIERFQEVMASMSPRGDWMSQISGIEGTTVRQKIVTGPATTTSEVVSVETGDAPAGIYEPPEGYTEVSIEDLRTGVGRR